MTTPATPGLARAASATDALVAGFEPPLVDTHAHVYLTSMPLAPGAWHRPPHDASTEQYLQTLDQHGVRFAVLAAASIFGDYNDYTIEATRRHPRLRATIIAHPGMDPYRLERMAGDGVVGIRLQWRNVRDIPDLESPQWRLLLRRVADRDWHVHIHDESPRLAMALPALENAGIRKIVVDHFGRPKPETGGLRCPGFQAVLQAIDRGHTWVKVSAAFRLESIDAARRCAAELLRVGGPERLLWGSDWPFAAFEDRVSYQSTLDAFAQCVPDARARRIIGSETPMSLYFS